MVSGSLGSCGAPELPGLQWPWSFGVKGLLGAGTDRETPQGSCPHQARHGLRSALSRAQAVCRSCQRLLSRGRTLTSAPALKLAGQRPAGLELGREPPQGSWGAGSLQEGPKAARGRRTGHPGPLPPLPHLSSLLWGWHPRERPCTVLGPRPSLSGPGGRVALCIAQEGRAVSAVPGMARNLGRRAA